MRLLAPAKINVFLRIAPPDGSGFHPLLTWMCTVGLFDTITIERTASDQVSLECDNRTLPVDQTNLVLRAAQAMRARAGQAASGLTMHLSKRIPAGAGLGGGSSDAARVLLGLNRLWNLNWPIDRLAGIAAELGSDVPFFLHGSSSLCTGRGEIVHPVGRPRPKWALLLLPDMALATVEVYRQFDRMRLGDAAAVRTNPPLRQWADLSAGLLLERLVNDLETPAFAICPRLGQLRQEIEHSLGRIVRMSGSGSSLFTLFDTSSEARAAETHVVQRHALRAQTVELAPEANDDLAAWNHPVGPPGG